jgi:bacteriochlorophyllide a dehydrogenase
MAGLETVMQTQAVIFEKPGKLSLGRLVLADPKSDEILVAADFSAISTGTERLLWTGRMPAFPGLAYPLVPGYETVGRVVVAGDETDFDIGDHVFVPGADCYGDVRGLFGGAASRLVTKASRTTRIDPALGEDGVLLALAATAYHAIASARAQPPQLIVGHGVLGRLLARLTVALGHESPVVWEENADRHAGAAGYSVVRAGDDDRCNYASIYDASGAAGVLDQLMPRLAKGGEITLAGFYEAPVAFGYPMAFMREARLRVAAEWVKSDLEAVTALVASGALQLSGLITHHMQASEARTAYDIAFNEPACLKMSLDWRGHA